MMERDGIPAGIRCVKASEFKTECLQLMDEVGATGEEIVVTNNGRPAAKLVPYRSEPVSWFGRDRGRIEIKGDIVSPVDVVKSAFVLTLWWTSTLIQPTASSSPPR